MSFKKEQEKDYAKLLYLQGYTYKIIAEKAKVSERTITRWVESENWDKLRKSLLVTKDKQLRMLYDQLDAINLDISLREEKKYPTNAEADTIAKITSSIQRLETETGLGETIEVFMKYGNFVQKHNPELFKQVNALCDSYIESMM